MSSAISLNLTEVIVTYLMLRRIVNVVGIVTLVVLVADKLIAYGPRAALFGQALGRVALIVNAMPYLSSAVFLVLQAVGARAIVPLPGTRFQDSWLFILIATTAIPSSTTVMVATSDSVFASPIHPIAAMGVAMTALFIRIGQLRGAPASGAVVAEGPVIH